MSALQFKVGDFILVTGNPCHYRTCIGLPGVVTKVFPGEGKYYLKLLQKPMRDTDEDIRAEKHGRFDTYGTSADVSEVIRLRDPVQLKRVAAMWAVEEAEERKPTSPVITKIMKDIGKVCEKRKARDKLIEAAAATVGQVFTLPGRIKRYDKSEYPAISQPEVRAIGDEIRHYACTPNIDDLTPEQHVRWRQALAASDMASHWSGREEVRALVKEFDLDPMCERFNFALFHSVKTVFCLNGQLRNTVIPLWNRGAHIIDVEDGSDAQTLWSDYKPGPPPGFLLTYAFRRKLPLPPS